MEPIAQNSVIVLSPSVNSGVESRAMTVSEYSAVPDYCAIQLVNRFTYVPQQQNSYEIQSDGSLHRVTSYNGVTDYYADASHDNLYVNNGAGFYMFRAFANFKSIHSYSNTDWLQQQYTIETNDVPAISVDTSYVNADGNVSFTVRPLSASLYVKFYAADGETAQEVDSAFLVGLKTCKFNMQKLQMSRDSLAPTIKSVAGMVSRGVLTSSYGYKFVPPMTHAYVDNITPAVYDGSETGGVMMRIYTNELVGGVRQKHRYDVMFPNKESFSFNVGKRYSMNIIVGAKEAVIDGGIIVSDFTLSPDVIDIKYGPE